MRSEPVKITVYFSDWPVHFKERAPRNGNQPHEPKRVMVPGQLYIGEWRSFSLRFFVTCFELVHESGVPPKMGGVIA